MLWLFVGPTGVYLLDFFCSSIQFNLLLSPYPCFISLLYLDLYVLGDDALGFLLTVPRRYFFCGSFMFLFCLLFAMFCARLFICASWSPAGKGLTSWFSFVVSSVSLSLSHWYPGSGVVLDCIDS